jgi:uncharacterized membrane protein YesL
MATSNDAPSKDSDFFTLVGEAFKMYKESWEALKLNLATFILAVIVPAGIIMLGVFISVVLGLFSTNTSDSGSSLGLILGLLVVLASVVLALVFAPAITITQLESVKGKKVQFSEVFEQSKKYVLRFIGLGILAILLIEIPALLLFFTIFLFPLGIAWIVVSAFFLVLAPYILINKDLGVIDTLKASFEVTKKNWQWVLAAYVVLVAVNIISVVPFIGWIISLVLSFMYFCLIPLIYVKKIN